MTCAVQVQVKHSLNKSTLYVQSGLKYNNLCGKCPERIHYMQCPSLVISVVISLHRQHCK